jgi:putative FmdB family regulatory protein
VPSYDYRCNNCKRRVTLSFKTYADYDKATKVCPRCQSTDLTRLISRVAIAKSEESRFSSMDDETSLAELENADPSTIGRYMRRMSSELGEDLGEEFHEVVDRLEHGESPEDIESSMPDPDSGGASLPGDSDFD